MRARCLLKDRAEVALPQGVHPCEHRAALMRLDVGEAGIEHAESERKVRIVDLVVGPGALGCTHRQGLPNEPAGHEHIKGVLDTLLRFRGDGGVARPTPSNRGEDP